VSDSWLTFVDDKTEWDGTRVVFDIAEKGGRTEVTFTHVGTDPEGRVLRHLLRRLGVTSSLRSLITTGKGYPHRTEDTFESGLEKHRDNQVGSR